MEMKLLTANSKRARRAIAAVAIAVTAIAGADEVDVPHVFQSGDTASASDVNANFSTVEAAIDDNAREIESNAMSILSNMADIASNMASIAASTAAIEDLQSGLESVLPGVGVLVDGAEVGRFVGFVPRTRTLDLGALLGMSPPNQKAATITYVEGGGAESASSIEVLSDEGYLFQLSTSGVLRSHTIWYDQPGCQGAAYWNFGPSGGIPIFIGGSPGSVSAAFTLRQGVVFASPGTEVTPSGTYYLPRDAETETVVLQSYLSSDALSQPVCEAAPPPTRPFDDGSFRAVRLQQNSPDVTGVSAYAGGAVELH